MKEGKGKGKGRRSPAKNPRILRRGIFFLGEKRCSSRKKGKKGKPRFRAVHPTLGAKKKGKDN